MAILSIGVWPRAQVIDISELRKVWPFIRVLKQLADYRTDLDHFLGRPQSIESRHQRIMHVAGISRPLSFTSPLSSTARVNSSTNNGTPPVRSTTVATVSSESAILAATCATQAFDCRISD
jgi:hypothetical protein